MAVPAEPVTFAVAIVNWNHSCGVFLFEGGLQEASASEIGEEIVAVTLPAVSNCVLRWAQAIVNAGTRNKWVRFPRTEEFLRFGPQPGVIECVNSSFVTVRSEHKAAF
ncbi:hypothetical protein MRX96_055247 [Rhipicephalus microplus]